MSILTDEERVLDFETSGIKKRRNIKFIKTLDRLNMHVIVIPNQKKES